MPITPKNLAEIINEMKRIYAFRCDYVPKSNLIHVMNGEMEDAIKSFLASFLMWAVEEERQRREDEDEIESQTGLGENYINKSYKVYADTYAVALKQIAEEL